MSGSNVRLRRTPKSADFVAWCRILFSRNAVGLLVHRLLRLENAATLLDVVTYFLDCLGERHLNVIEFDLL